MRCWPRPWCRSRSSRRTGRRRRSCRCRRWSRRWCYGRRWCRCRRGPRWCCGQAGQLRNACVKQERLGSCDRIDCVEISGRRAAIESAIRSEHDIRDYGFHRTNRRQNTGDLIDQIKIFQAIRRISANHTRGLKNRRRFRRRMSPRRPPASAR
jgi:hypothetical protein